MSKLFLRISVARVLSLVFAFYCFPWRGLSQTTNATATPSADAFVRSLLPSDNFGAAGALSISGSAAVNGLGTQNGLFDTLIRFPMSGVAASLNAALGPNQWKITGIALNLNEVGAPNDPEFNRGVGAFELRWIASDFWIEGTGRPNFPTTDGVTYQDLPSILDAAVDVSVGRFTNSGVSGPLSFPLPPANVLVSNIMAGADLNFYLAAASPSIGFTFNSRNYGLPSAWPALQITATQAPVPVIESISQTGANQVAIGFTMSSNWTYQVQRAGGLPATANGGWAVVSTYAARATNSHQIFLDHATNAASFYRLAVSP